MNDALERIGPYEVEGELARGGMGVVHVARHPSLGRRVAVKQLLSHYATAEELQRFMTEARSVAQLSHPGIVPIHEIGEHDGHPYIVMDLIEGETLKARLDREGTLEPHHAARLIRDLAEAVEHAHSRSILHRDIKPANVLLTSDGRPVLTDFGLARDLSEERERLTRTGQTLGTPAYMPPEQANGELDRIDRRADVYALGATLYTLLTGAPPFRGPTPLNILNAVLRHRPLGPRKLRPELHPDLEAICLRCLEKVPRERFATAEDLGAELERYLAGQPTRTRPLGRLGKLKRSITWGRSLMALALLLAVGILMGVALSPDPPASEVSNTRGELLRALQSVERDGKGSKKLAALLAEDPDVEPELLARAHLALASRKATDPSEWEDRQRHARRARELDPDLEGVDLADARALRGLGRHGPAAEAYRRAMADEPGVRRELARTLLEAKQLEAADRVAGKLEGPGDRVLRAEIKAAKTRSPQPLRIVVSDSGGPAALARHLLVYQLDARSAARVPRLEDAGLRRLFDALLATPPDAAVVARALPPLRTAAQRWLLAEAQRELAFVQRFLDIRNRTSPRAVSTEARIERARRLLEALLDSRPPREITIEAHLSRGALGSLKERKAHIERALAPSPRSRVALLRMAELRLEAGQPDSALGLLSRRGDGQGDRWYQRLKGRALLATNQPAAAAQALEAALGERQDDVRIVGDLAKACRLAGLPEAARWNDRAARLRGSRREEAAALYERVRENRGRGTLLDPNELRGYEKVLALDPLHWDAFVYQAILLLGTRDRRMEGMRQATLGVMRAPVLLEVLLEKLRRTVSGVGRVRGIYETIPFDPSRLRDRLARSILVLATLPKGGDIVEPMADLKAVLESDPAIIPAWILAGMALALNGQLDRAERALTIARRAEPTSGTIFLYLALIAEQRGEPSTTVLELLDEAERFGVSSSHRFVLFGSSQPDGPR